MTPLSRCQVHDRPLEWIKTGDGKQVLGCPLCRDRREEQRLHDLRNVPRIKYAQNFFRDRLFTEAEKRAPARKPVD